MFGSEDEEEAAAPKPSSEAGSKSKSNKTTDEKIVGREGLGRLWTPHPVCVCVCGWVGGWVGVEGGRGHAAWGASALASCLGSLGSEGIGSEGYYKAYYSLTTRMRCS